VELKGLQKLREGIKGAIGNHTKKKVELALRGEGRSRSEYIISTAKGEGGIGEKSKMVLKKQTQRWRAGEKGHEKKKPTDACRGRGGSCFGER